MARAKMCSLSAVQVCSRDFCFSAACNSRRPVTAAVAAAAEAVAVAVAVAVKTIELLVTSQLASG